MLPDGTRVVGAIEPPPAFNPFLTVSSEGDFDGDGLPDLILGNRRGVWVATSPLDVAEPQYLAWTEDGGGGMALGDLDGEGLTDVSTTDIMCMTIGGTCARYDGFLKVYRGGTIDGAVAGLIIQVSTGGRLTSIVGADLDGDGGAEPIASNYGITYVFPGTSSGILPPTDARLPAVGAALWAGDFDADGAADRVTVDQSTGLVLGYAGPLGPGTLAESDATWTWTDPATPTGYLTTALGGPAGLAIAAYDADVSRGRIHLYAPGIDGDPDSSTATWTGARLYAAAGTSLAWFEGDGGATLAVGAG